jgi:hypothetical protein
MNMNNPYIVERLVQLRMEDMQNEMRQAHLLKEAGLSEPNWLARLVNALPKPRITRRKELQNRPSAESQSYPSHRKKTAA